MAAYLPAFTSVLWGNTMYFHLPKWALRFPSNAGYVSEKFSDTVWELWELISEPITERYIPVRLIPEGLISNTGGLVAAHNAGQCINKNQAAVWDAWNHCRPDLGEQIPKKAILERPNIKDWWPDDGQAQENPLCEKGQLKWANRREKPKGDSHIPKKANLEWMGRHRIDGKRPQKVRNQHRSINRSVKWCPIQARALNSIFGQIWIVYHIGICQGAHRSAENISTIPPRPYTNIFEPSNKAGQPNINPAVFQPQQ